LCSLVVYGGFFFLGEFLAKRALVLQAARLFLLSLLLLPFALKGGLDWYQLHPVYEKDQKDLLASYWHETGFSLEQAKDWLPLNSQCLQEDSDTLEEVDMLRRRRACRMALLRLKQICEEDRIPVFSWTGIERIEIIQMEKESSLFSFKEEDFLSSLESCSKEKKSFALAQAVNGFLSIEKDPHSYVLPLRYFDEVLSKPEVKNNFFGFSLRRNKNFDWVVTKLSSQGEGFLSGLRWGDRIVEIQNHLVSELSPKKIQDFLNTENVLKLKVERYQKNNKLSSLNVLLKPSKQSVLNVRWDWIDFKNKIGSVRIEKFSKKSCDDFKKVLKILNSKAIKVLALDLRDNPGGSVEEAACIMDALVPKGLLLFSTYDQKQGYKEAYYSHKEPLFKKEMFVFINQGSASASEIVAGGLKVLGRATLVGQPTFGKGTYQDGMILESTPSLAYFETRGYYLFSDGSTAQIQGVIPDLVVEEHPYLSSLMREEDLYAYPLKQRPHTGVTGL
jgi:carboxyl-terminal processing protease